MASIQLKEIDSSIIVLGLIYRPELDNIGRVSENHISDTLRPCHYSSFHVHSLFLTHYLVSHGDVNNVDPI